MFANLKNKLIEEVKSSKFQQFANAAQAAVSSSTSTTPSSDSTATTNENFFSITEEDTPQNSPLKEQKLPFGANRGRPTTPQSLNNGTGAIPRTRKLSNSSMASDISFRLPAYESTAVYHLQSDWDASGSEMDDSASTTKLDVISKEHLYDAYRKTLERCHKYRCRYTDLAKKYKDLERDSTKARSVLVETQEKAIRRISELREQCSLEQQAKAHLEEALRMEMDDLQCKMQAYQTKLTLLGENPESITAAVTEQVNQINDSLIDLGYNSQETTNNLINLNVSPHVDSLDKILKLEQQLQERDSQIKQLHEKLQNSTANIELLKKQEEENALLLAQTKQAIHSELENKEKEVNTLNETIKKMQAELQAASKKENQLNAQIDELKELKEKLKQVQASKQEVEAKVIANEHLLTQLKEQYASKEAALMTAEEKIAALTKTYEETNSDLKQENVQLSEIVQRYQQKEVSLADVDNELNRTKNENNNIIKNLSAAENSLRELEAKHNEQVASIQNMQQELVAKEDQVNNERLKAENLVKQLDDERASRLSQEQHVKQLESEIKILNEQSANNESETIALLKQELHKTNAETSEQLSQLKDQLAAKEKELKASTNKLNKQKKQHENLQNKAHSQSEEIDKLKIELNKHETHLQSLLDDAKERENQNELEKNELKTQVTNILQEISLMEQQLRVVQQSHNELENEKLQLETRIETMQQETAAAAEDTARWRELQHENVEKVRDLELKLLNVQSENSQLSEKTCLLEENANRLEKLRAEQERQQVAEETDICEMRLKLETAENTVQKLNEKMSQVLDENSRMQNAQELMEHDYRTLQDKYDSLEKEKHILEDAVSCKTAEIQELEQSNEATIAQLQQLETSLPAELNKSQALTEQVQILNAQLSELQATQCHDDKLLQEQQKQCMALQAELAKMEEQYRINIQACEDEISLFKSEVKILTDTIAENELNKAAVEKTLNDEIVQLREAAVAEKLQATAESKQNTENFKALSSLLETTKQELDTSNEMKVQLETELELQKNLLAVKTQSEQMLLAQLDTQTQTTVDATSVQAELVALRKVEEDLRAVLLASKNNYMQSLQELELKLVASTADVEKLHESNDALQLEIDQLHNKHQLQVQQLESNLQQLQLEHEQHKTQMHNNLLDTEKLTKYAELQVENEYLNKHTKQLEAELEQRKHDTLSKQQEFDDLKEKLKSLQCELYVLKENAEKHDVEIKLKNDEMTTTNAAFEQLKSTLEDERIELTRQTAHASYVTEQNDAVQKELLHTQQLLVDVEHKLQSTTAELEKTKLTSADEIQAKVMLIDSLRADIDRNTQTIETLNLEISDLTKAAQAATKLQDEVSALKVEVAERANMHRSGSSLSQTEAAKQTHSDSEHLRKINESLQRELEDLKYKSTAEISNLQQEIEDMQSSAKHMSEKLLELQQQQSSSSTVNERSSNVYTTVPASNIENNNEFSLEKEELEAKLKTIMSEVQDVSNRNIFLEQKCENYLILEQSNERLKLQNAKLSRQLDETLVSMQHNEGITANTEFEYLKNIMFQYLTGSANGNNETLVKVISAVLKFSPQQTQVALEKEHQRRSLINKIL